MALEAATYISGLVSTNPPGTDQVAQADDHLRLIKATLLNTFPSVTGAVTATHTAINTAAASPLVGTTGAVDTLPYYTGTSTASTTSFTSYGRTVVGLANAAALLSNLGVPTAANHPSLATTNTWALGQTFSSTVAISGAATFSSTVATGALTVTGAIVASGDITAFSDARLKSDVETIDDALDLVRALRGVRYTKDGARGVGVIAQEVLSVVPEAVVVPEDPAAYQSVAYGNLVGVLIEAIKELETKVDVLEARLGGWGHA